MPDPLSATTAVTLTIGGVTVASLLQHHSAISTIIGAISGSLIYILSLDDVNVFRKIGYFIVSFFTGLIAASPATDFIAKTGERLLEHPVTIHQSLGAVVAAAVAVRLLIRCIEKVSPASGKGSEK